MGRYLRQPYLGHVAILAVLIASVGIARAVWIEPRARETASLRTEAVRLEAEITDLEDGVRALDAWKRAHPGRAADRYDARRALPARSMVAAFLRDVAPAADRWKVGTELIQPAGALVDETVPDDAGRSITYRRAELRFRLTAPYRALGAYLADVEAMDQLVVVRSVNVAFDARAYPDLTADVTIWLYGTP